MKQCPRCNQTYTDDQLNFCLSDGELLTNFAQAPTRYADDAPPTVMLGEPRVTNPADWPASPQSGPPAQLRPAGLPPPLFGQNSCSPATYQSLVEDSAGL